MIEDDDKKDKRALRWVLATELVNGKVPKGSPTLLVCIDEQGHVIHRDAEIHNISGYTKGYLREAVGNNRYWIARKTIAKVMPAGEEAGFFNDEWDNL